MSAGSARVSVRFRRSGDPKIALRAPPQRTTYAFPSRQPARVFLGCRGGPAVGLNRISESEKGENSQ
jgi:hypothetical protein